MGDDRAKITVELPADLVEECRNAVVFLSGPPEGLTLAGLVADALREKLHLLCNLRNGGESFPNGTANFEVEGRPSDDGRGARPRVDALRSPAYYK